MVSAALSAKPHNWVRFGLRSFFLFITIVAFAAAWVGAQISRRQMERSAVADLTRKNPSGYTTVVVKSRFDRLPSDQLKPLTPAFQIAPTGFWDRLRNLDLFQRVVMLSSCPGGNTFTYQVDEAGRLKIEREYKYGLVDADMKWVGKLKDLRSLWLEAHGIGDPGFAKLAKLRELEILWLQRTAVGDAEISVLSNFPKLRMLNLSCTYVTDASVESICKCRQLTDLNVESTNITPAGIEAIKQALPNCRIKN